MNHFDKRHEKREARKFKDRREKAFCKMDIGETYKPREWFVRWYMGAWNIVRT